MFPKTEPALEGEMDMFAFQTIADMQIAKDRLTSGGQEWWWGNFPAGEGDQKRHCFKDLKVRAEGRTWRM